MTPREKALQLCQKFGYLGIKWEQAEYTTLSLENAKECALIAVDEIYKTNLKHGAYIETDWDKTYYYSYWEDVKHEIQKL
jgi:predicted proteasome-type protease